MDLLPAVARAKGHWNNVTIMTICGKLANFKQLVRTSKMKIFQYFNAIAARAIMRAATKFLKSGLGLFYLKQYRHLLNCKQTKPRMPLNCKDCCCADL